MNIESEKSKYQFLFLLQLVRCGAIETQRKGNYCCDKSTIQNLCSDCQTIFCRKCKSWMSYEAYRGCYKLNGDSCSDCRDSKKQSRSLTKKLRFLVLSRDNFTCRYCGRSAPKVELHVDHITPVSKGGDNSFNNLIAACGDCNLGKSDIILDKISTQKYELSSHGRY